MGQKVNPNGFRYGITKNYNVSWFTNKKGEFVNFLIEDHKIRSYFDKFIRKWQIGNLTITRDAKNEVVVIIHSALPGKIQGQGGENTKKIILDLKKHLKNKNLKINLIINTIEQPELNAQLVAEEIATKLENREPFRVAQKSAIWTTLKAGAKGIKTAVAGRLNGVEMARTEGYNKGEMKLHTLRQDVNYAKTNAHTTYGTIGVKVWISKGEIKGDNDAST